jgi:adenosylcobinamide-phosphate synthase
MTPNPPVLASAGILLAVLLDRCLGDPLHWPHPVVVMGWWITRLRQWAEAWAQDSPTRLRLGGLAITLIVVSGSCLSGWWIEQLAQGRWISEQHWLMLIAQLLLVIGLASALAGRSLEQAVMAVLSALASNNQALARQRLQWIVGRDTSELNPDEILRAAAETAAENAVDGLFTPLFWMLAGLVVWQINPHWPGSLALAWGFKAASTLDSMLGYRTGRLNWLGTAGAKLDDLLVWPACRLVMLSLPLVSAPWKLWPQLVSAAERDGKHDPSPNAGRAEAIYAHCAGVRLGGRNCYGDRWVIKPLLAAVQPAPNREGVMRILRFSQRLELAWLLFPLAMALRG